MSSTRTQLAVCVCTYHRPRGLARVLSALAAMDVVPSAQVRVVVSDNDPDAGARGQVEAAARTLGVEVLYTHASEPGIAAARNAALDAAGDVDAVAFLDDDEWPERAWLAELVRVWREAGTDVVTGPVLPAFEQGAPAWVLAGRFFERPRFATGTTIGYARTSNVLISAAVLRGSGLRFEATPNGGGEDTVLFDRAIELGHRVAWADTALVHESVPRSRMSARWLLLRSYRYGLTRSDMLRMAGAPPRRRARRAARGLLTVLAAVVAAPVRLRRGRAGAVATAQQMALGAGLVAGWLGATYDDYRVADGS